MTEPRSDPRKLKQLISDHVLRVDGVTGVGIPGGTLTVYLARDDAHTRERVEQLLRRHAPGVRHSISITGEFRAFSR